MRKSKKARLRRRRTRIFHLAGGKNDQRALAYASAVLRKGGLVVFPTETVYGLGANALSEKAVRDIFRVKGRPSDNPLIVHLSSVDDLPLVAQRVPALAKRLAANFWPGPLTLVLPARSNVPKVTTAGMDSVAVRVPNHPIARQLIAGAGVPVAAPSANLSSRPSLTSPAYLLQELSGKVDVLLLAGNSPIGVESTVIDVRTSPPVVLRPGGLSVERIRKVAPSIELPTFFRENSATDTNPPRSPGLRHRHYAPKARVTLYVGPPSLVWEAMRQRRSAMRLLRISLALLVSWESPLKGEGVWKFGSRYTPSTVASRLFRVLRDADASGVQEMLVEGIPIRGLGLAVMDRLVRAAEGRVIHVRDRKRRTGRGDQGLAQEPKFSDGSLP